MITIHPPRSAIAAAACALGLAVCLNALADDMTGFATARYVRNLRTPEMMHKIDTDHDGTVSREEWIAFQSKVFEMMDKNHTGTIDAREFISHGGGDVASFATGGYARGLRTASMMHRIDTDHDGTVSRDEFLAYQNKIFDLMDTSTTHKGTLGKEEMLATGGGNRP